MIKVENIRINLDIEFTTTAELNKFRTKLAATINEVLPPDQTSEVSFTYTETTPPKTTTEKLNE